jgi:hypothetical protein
VQKPTQLLPAEASAQVVLILKNQDAFLGARIKATMTDEMEDVVFPGTQLTLERF